jgi:hypothetical protein
LVVRTVGQPSQSVAQSRRGISRACDDSFSSFSVALPTVLPN